MNVNMEKRTIYHNDISLDGRTNYFRHAMSLVRALITDLHALFKFNYIIILSA